LEATVPILELVVVRTSGTPAGADWTRMQRNARRTRDRSATRRKGGYKGWKVG